MNKPLYFLLIICIITASSCGKKNSNPVIINLNDDWHFISAIFDRSYPSSVPGSVHTDLFMNDLIPDPYFGKNEQKLQWIDTLDWTYQKEFAKPKNLKPTDQVEIVFNGLDTYADVSLNDSLLLSADNMFIPWRLKIDQNDLRDKNILVVKFKSALKEGQKEYEKLNYDLPPGSRVCVRKAAYQYGWDWAPTYISSGIWQDAELQIWNKSIIRNLTYSIEKLDSISAVVNIKTEVESTEDYDANFKINSTNEPLKYSFENIPVKKGKHIYNFKIEIKNPKLWWVKNLGDPFLYRFNLALGNNKQQIDSEDINVGLRTIELIREPDKYGESFYFKLNGIPVFMKGANYVPQNSFPGVVSKKQYETIIQNAILANMNMLRVWGGGIYEKEIFYDLCDKEGIMIWQDFMFANAMYPNNEEFLTNIKTEAQYHAERLGKHPCIAVWCGNNEIDEAWHNWGWSRSYSKPDSIEIWSNYTNIFHHILPGIVDSISPGIPYTSTSPVFGRGNPRSSYEGDNHYWYVWHDKYDFSWYNKVTGRFMSEFGFQSFPTIETIEYFDTSANKTIDSEIMLAHQKHPKGNYLIKHYMKDYYPVPDDFYDFTYLSELLQAEGITTGILAQRRAKPFCMGSLYWQFNDCWPAVSWSGIDYSGNWKALHYFVRDDFKNIIIDPYLHNDSIDIYIVSDSLKQLELSLKLSLMDFDGNIKISETINLTVDENTSTRIYQDSFTRILNNTKPENHFLFLELLHDGKLLDSRFIYFTKPKNLELPEFEAKTTFTPVLEGYEVSIKPEKLVKNLYIHIPVKGYFNHNYFDLLPNAETKIVFKTKEKINNIHDIIEFKSLNHIQNKNLTE